MYICTDCTEAQALMFEGELNQLCMCMYVYIYVHTGMYVCT